MKKYNSMLIILFALSACAGIQHKVDDWSSIDAGPKPELVEIQPVIEETIRDKMIDPESTRFSKWTEPYKELSSWLSNSPVEGLWALCVDVNSKNRFGGYVGNRTFWVKVRNGKVVDMDSDKNSQSFYRKTCNEGALKGHRVLN